MSQEEPNLLVLVVFTLTMDKIMIPEPWVLKGSRSRPGRFYYYNPKTGRTSWEHPSQLTKRVEKIGATQEVKKNEVQKPCKRKNTAQEEPPPTKKTKVLSQPEHSGNKKNVPSDTTDKMFSQDARNPVAQKQEKDVKGKLNDDPINSSSPACHSHEITSAKGVQSSQVQTRSGVPSHLPRRTHASDHKTDTTAGSKLNPSTKARRRRRADKSNKHYTTRQSSSVPQTKEIIAGKTKKHADVSATFGSSLSTDWSEDHSTVKDEVESSLQSGSCSSKRKFDSAKDSAQAKLERHVTQTSKDIEFRSVSQTGKPSSTLDKSLQPVSASCSFLSSTDNARKEKIIKNSPHVTSRSGKESIKKTAQERLLKLTTQEPKHIQLPSVSHPVKVLSIQNKATPNVRASCVSYVSDCASDCKVTLNSIGGSRQPRLAITEKTDRNLPAATATTVDKDSSKNIAQQRLQKLSTSLAEEAHKVKSQPNSEEKRVQQEARDQKPELGHQQEDILKRKVTDIIGPASKRMQLLQNKMRSHQTGTQFKAQNEEPQYEHSSDDMWNEEAMEVEYTECDVLLHIEELRTACGVSQSDTGICQPSFLCEDMEVDVAPVNGSGAVHIVLDTNILLSQLGFVQNLQDKFIAGRGAITLFLPWQVLQELDRLKDHGKTSLIPLARRAINFLHGNFKLKHPRVRGQRFGDVNMELTSCPDDSILQACLQLQERGADVILVSNDINLCNKALVSGVTAFTKEQFEKELNNSVQVPTTNIYYPPNNSKTESPSPAECSVATSVMNDLKILVKNIFSQVVSRGMQKEYGHLWIKRTILPPPWEADEVFKCLIRHWLPICNSLLPEKIRAQGDQLVQLLSNKRRGMMPCDVEAAVNLTIDFVKAVSNMYEDLTKQAEQQLENLLKRLTNNDIPVPPHPIIAEDRTQEGGHMLVISCFQSVLNTINEFCNLEKQGGIGPAHMQQAEEILGAVQMLQHRMLSLLSKPIHSLSACDEDIRSLLQLVRGNNSLINENHLLAFCKENSTRKLLENGVSQFAQYAETLKMVLTKGSTFTCDS